ncbi:MAG: bacterioferritin [Xanthomonadales bacterium]|nr:bacterioferritin [Xanthomonadales bacterium]
MKGNPEIIDYLNFLLRGELAARDQYFIHSRRYEDLGLKALYQRINHEMEEEGEHADALIRRILFLGGHPDMRPDALNEGRTVEEMLRRDLDLEYAVRDNLAKGVAMCERHGDYVTRDLLVDQMEDTEEDHMHWLEQQLRLIEMIGIERFLQSMMAEGSSPHS